MERASNVNFHGFCSIQCILKMISGYLSQIESRRTGNFNNLRSNHFESFMIYQFKVSIKKGFKYCSRCPLKYFMSNSPPVSFILSKFYLFPVWIPQSSLVIAQEERNVHVSFTFLRYFLKYTKRVTLERFCLVEFCVIY
jgi:hypothetical protein